MPTPRKKAASEKAVQILEIKQDERTFHLLGTSPLIMHRFSQKAWQELLFPSEDLNKAARQQVLKHDPQAEFRGAFYRNRDENRKAMFHLPNGMLHGALAQAAIDIPGAAKAQITRLTRVTDLNIDLYGTPQIFSAMVRNSGMTRTPDVRTRPIFPEWACSLTIRWVRGLISERDIFALLQGAGVIVGIGDWRGERGGPFGAFEVVYGRENGANAAMLEQWEKYQRIVKLQGRKAQEEAYRNPDFYDEDTTDILSWFEAEIQRREKAGLLSSDFDLEPEGGSEHLRTVVERGGSKKEAGDFEEMIPAK
jgi:hypothetical protein